MTFDRDQFICDCRAAFAKDVSYKAVREIVARAVSDPRAVINALGDSPTERMQTLYLGEDLTILNVISAPNATLLPHDHNMWAVIGIYCGREDNIFWRRVPSDPRCRIEAVGAKSMSAKDATPLGRDVIHSAINPIARVTGAIHVYGGDLFRERHSEWDPETLTLLRDETGQRR
ncbi:MAG: hypothetical protein JO219_12565 [Candidatus Eremiobacteraeota bacterium]|nr:hypothetical protein [Candidatus Eremiobacteraeota bacterium]MBV8366310.1 hypothetical protein [Candidatus Eremiobacteraeota bacterium]